jgi:hypothetical protein
MRLSTFVATIAVGAACLISASAYAAEPASALDELKKGYGLKQNGKCPEAIPHFVESFRLEPKPKALLNLADCERQIGDLLAAREHATQGRDLARRQTDLELVGVAEEQLAALEKELPQLTLRLAGESPRDTLVVRDATVVRPETFGEAVALNPGAHRVMATAPGHVDREFEVMLAEGARQVVDVEPGPALASGQPTVAAHATPIVADSPSNRSESPRQVLTFGAFGVGGVGIGLGVLAGIAAGSKHTTLEGECPGNGCPPSSQSELDSFHSLKTWSTVGYVVGIAGLAGAGVLLLTAPRAASGATARVWIGPASAGLAGAF